ncbi:MAG: histidine kinase N-terminal 7TM domain-containing protein [Acidobacteriota bacterium]|nr:histidine kinase N-terminal 7TM domain-containing protein [Acidobacteriota bacterium]
MWSTNVTYTAILVAGSIILLMLALYTWFRRRTSITFPFVGLLAGAALYAFGYAWELASTRIEGMLTWTRVEYLGIVVIPIFWLMIATLFAGRSRWLSKPILAAMVGFSALTVVIIWTNPLHHLYHRSLSLSTAGPFPLLLTEKGVWFWMFQIYVNLALAIGTMMLISALIRSSAAYRKQAALMVCGALIPWLGYAAYAFGISPYGLDTGPFGLILIGPLFALGLFRFRLLDLVPVARDAVFLGMTEGVIVLDDANRVIDCNPAARRLFPGLGSNAVGHPISEVLKRYPAACGLLNRSAEPGAEIGIEIDGRLRYYQVRLSPIRNRRGRVICRALSFGDSTEQTVLRKRLSSLASTDELTGAANRRAFLEQGRREIARAKRSGHALSLIIIDLDHFKAINDRWGHAAGDAALVEACRRFKSGLRAGDTLGRHGGEEFAILLPETPPDQAVQAAERLRAALASESLPIGEAKPVNLTASFGVAGIARVSEETIEILVRAADQAMYDAKAAGRDCVRAADGIVSPAF